MCGIVGYTGHRQASDVLMSGLGRLEYRGYDSAGVAIIEGDDLTVVRRVGRLANLREATDEHPVHGSAGIGHTRWATHGRPSEDNAHPHTDCDGRIAVVYLDNVYLVEPPDLAGTARARVTPVTFSGGQSGRLIFGRKAAGRDTVVVLTVPPSGSFTAYRQSSIGTSSKSCWNTIAACVAVGGSTH